MYRRFCKATVKYHSCATMLLTMSHHRTIKVMGVITDSTVTMLAIVLTGLEEVFTRSTMVYRDLFFRRIRGMPKFREDEEEMQKRFWSASVASSMYHEFVSIITSRLAYMVMRPHRFVFNLGYINSSGRDHPAMSSTAMLLSALFLELAFEFVVRRNEGKKTLPDHHLLTNLRCRLTISPFKLSLGTG